MWKGEVRLMPQLPLPKGKMHLPLNGRLGGPQSQSGHFGEDSNPLPLLVFEHQIIQSVA